MDSDISTVPPSPLENQPGSHMGKVLILGIMVVAFAMAGFGWWFRFQSTHETAAYWGPEAAQLIRDAPQVYAYRLSAAELSPDWAGQLDSQAGPEAELPTGVLAASEVTKAPGMTHLRTALLEDRSFHWTDSPVNRSEAAFALYFVEEAESARLLLGFSGNCQTLLRFSSAGEVESTLSTAPISAGLSQVFSEMLPEADDSSR